MKRFSSLAFLSLLPAILYHNVTLLSVVVLLKFIKFITGHGTTIYHSLIIIIMTSVTHCNLCNN